MRVSSRSSLGAGAVAAVLATALAAPALAHPFVDEGRSRYEQADLDGALDAFARAEAAEDLSRADLLLLLESRVMVQLARGDQAAAERDLAALRSLDPDHEFGRDVPPEVVETFRDLGTGVPLAVTLDVGPDGDGSVVTARVTDDPTGLTREVRIHARLDGGEWLTEVGEERRLEAAPGAVEAYAEAVGPGGAVLAGAGTRDRPIRGRGGAELLAGGEVGATSGDDGGGFPWLWVAAGGVLVAGVVVAILLAGGGDDGQHDTQPAFPMVEF